MAGKLAGVGAFHAYPELSMSAGAGELALVAAIVAAGVLPFAGTRARLGVSRV